jgi:hypothetical protein
LKFRNLIDGFRDLSEEALITKIQLHHESGQVK